MKIRLQTLPKSDMWKTLLRLACVASCILIVSCDEGDTDPTAETNPTGETSDTGETLPTEETKPTEETDDCSGNPPTCGKNEVYNNCTNLGCIPKLCSEIGFLLKCDQECKPGCICKDNYVRDEDGTCIPIHYCPSCGGDKNAQQGCSNYCGQSCVDYNTPRSCPQFCIFNGCTCRKGFVYDYNVKACVKPKDCTPYCKANEEYSACINGGCDARSCSQLGKRVPCVKLAPESCIKGCVCKAGYLRADNGTCVPKDQCFSKCEKPNEVYDACPAPCPPKLCNVNEALIRCKAPPKPGDPECEPGCRCANNYYRNATGTCVLKNKCEKPLKCDRPNEVYDACPTLCPAQCGVDPSMITCRRNPDYGEPNCKPGCVCVDGYVRKNGRECISKDKCPICTGQNEYYEPCIQGCSNQTCDTIGKTYFCPSEESCSSGCRCKPGYYRNADNVCVPESECPKTCGPHEHFEKCITSCSNETCAEIGKSYTCPAHLKCKSGCRCDKGYWRDTNNVCIPESKCPKTCGPHEHFEKCITSCSNETCAEIGKSYTCPAHLKCRSGCRCDKGYWRDTNNVCIPESKCPKPCGENEYWEPCIIGCSTQSCNKLGHAPRSCPGETVGQCPSGCRCKPKYYRNSDNVCIPESECPRCYGENEHWEKCITDCTNQSCADVGKEIHCPEMPAGQCRSGCRCNSGGCRDANNKCVPIIASSSKPPTTEVTTPSPNTPVVVGTGSGLAGILDGIAAFTGKCLYNRIKSGGLENIIMSAMSIFTPIAELCLYSEGAAFEQCLRILNLKDKQDIRDTFPKFASSYEGQTKVNFSTAGKVYSNENYELNDAFKKEVVTYFHAEAEELDFSKNIQAAAIINAWVESKTNNRIKDLVSPDVLSALTRLVLVNAIYFKGKWLYQFNKNDTKDEDFYLNDGTTKKTKMMYQQGSFDYGEYSDLDCTALEIPYEGDNFTMLLILPNKHDGLLTLAEKMQYSANYNKIRQGLYPQKVQVYIPSCEIDTTTDLKDLLQENNITQWFNCQNSGLSGILANPPADICITTAIQKAFCKIDETGSEAAAANVIIASGGSRPSNPLVFRANHGFLYYIIVKGKGNKDLPVFTGAVCKPN